MTPWCANTAVEDLPEVTPMLLAPRLLLAYGFYLEGPFHPTVRIPGVCVSLVVDGAVRYRLSTGRTGRAEKGQALVHYPGLSGYDLEPGQRYCRYAVYFQAGPGPLGAGVPVLPGHGPLPEVLSVRDAMPSIVSLYEQIFQAMLAQRATWQLETARCITGIVQALFDAALDQQVSPREEVTRWDRLLAQIENAVDVPSVSQLARRFGLGVEQFIREFARHVGRTPKQYILARRLYRARRLLQDGAMVKEAAYRSGFRSAAHFSRAYRKQFGYPPSHTPPPGEGIVPSFVDRFPAQRQFWAPGVGHEDFAP